MLHLLEVLCISSHLLLVVFERFSPLCLDPNFVYMFVGVCRVFLAGQSAGAHLAACALVKQAQKEGFEDPTKLSWSSCKLKAFLAISGG